MSIRDVSVREKDQTKINKTIRELVSTTVKTGDIGTTVQGYDADTLFADVGDDLTAGYTSDDFAHGTVSSGTVTPAPATGQENYQTLTNGGAFTLAPPANSCSVVIHVTNNASAGAITTTGFTLTEGTSLLTTTNADEFLLYITKVSDVSHLTVKALQ